MKKIWEKFWLILGIAMCLVAFGSFVYTCEYFRFTELVVSFASLAIGILIFLKKRNTGLGVIYIVLAAAFALQGIEEVYYAVAYSFGMFSVGLYYVVYSVITIVSYAAVAYSLLITGISVLKKGQMAGSKVVSVAVFAPVVIVPLYLLENMAQNMSIYNSAFSTLSFWSMIFNCILSVALIMNLFYANPGFNIKSKEGKKQPIYLVFGVLASIVGVMAIKALVDITSLIYEVNHHFGYSYNSVCNVVCMILACIAIVAAVIGFIGLVFLIQKAREEAYAARMAQGNSADFKARADGEDSSDFENVRAAGENNSGFENVRAAGEENSGEREKTENAQANMYYVKSSSNEGLIRSNGYVNMALHICLYIFTFGVWNCIWVYKTTKYLNRTPGAEYCNPTTKLLLFMFVPFYSIYWYYKQGQKMEILLKSQGKDPSDMAVLCLLFGIFLQLVAVILMQDKINISCDQPVPARPQSAGTKATPQTKAAPQEAGHAPQTNAASQTRREKSESEKMKEMADALSTLKSLLDDGIITEEEYNRKKSEILG